MPQIGWFEILLIAVIAIIIIGPKDFPVMLKKVGSWIGTIKRYFSTLQKEVSLYENENFDTDVTQSDLPVLIDFWAVWCGPCKAIAPVIEEIAGEYEGQVKVGKVDVDKNQNTAMKFGVRSIPTLLVIKDGEVVNQIVGAVPKGSITDILKEVI